MPSVQEPDKAETKTIGGRARETQIRAIDLAAAIEGTTRGEFLVEQGYQAAMRILRERAPQLIPTLKSA